MIIDEVSKKLKEIEKQKSKILNSLKHAPGGMLKSEMARGKFPQYYFLSPEEKSIYPNGRYLRNSEREFARQLAQKEYDQKCLNALLEDEKNLKKLSEKYDEKKLISIYSGMPKAKQLLVRPYHLTDEQFIEKWYQEHPGCQNRYPIKDKHQTERGEIVRSKSEKIIADKLFYMHIPYQFEPVLIVDGYTSYPDFVILNVRTRQTFWFEHLGMMDDPKYVKANIQKINRYQANGYNPGKNFLYTMECGSNPVSKEVIDAMIAEYFL